MVVAALAVPYGPSCSRSMVILNVFLMIASGLRYFTPEPHSRSPGLVRLNVALVAIPFTRANRRALQSWLVTSVNSKMSSSARMQLPPLHPMTIASGSIDTGSNKWARYLCPTGSVSTGVKLGMKVSTASTVRGSVLLLLIPSRPSWARSIPSSTGPCGPR